MFLLLFSLINSVQLNFVTLEFFIDELWHFVFKGLRHFHDVGNCDIVHRGAHDLHSLVFSLIATVSIEYPESYESHERMHNERKIHKCLEVEQ